MLFLRPGHSLFFPDSLSAHFNSMDRYRSIAHFADFQVRSSLNRSKKTSSSLLEKSTKTLDRSLNYGGSLCVYSVYECMYRAPCTPAWRQIIHTLQAHTTYVTVCKEKRRQSGAALRSF